MWLQSLKQSREGHAMNRSSKTRRQLFLEIEELGTALDVARQRLQEANESLLERMTERNPAEDVLAERLKFETLLADISAHFVNLPADRIDSEILEAQRRICELLHLDRSSLWRFCEGAPGTLQMTHLHQPPGSLVPAEPINTRDYFPWVHRKLMGGETVIITKMSDLPREASRDLESFRLYGTRAVVVVPLSVGGGSVFGALTFAVMREERSWPETVVKGFQLIAHVFANAFARGEAERSLKERLQFEMLLADISARFVNLPADQLDGAIEDAQRLVCECLGLDLSALWQWSAEDPGLLTITHIYRSLEGPPLPEPMDAREYFPWCGQQLKAGKLIAVSSMEDLPAEAARDRETWRHYGVKTSLTFPLSVGDEPPIGAMSFNTMRAERAWPETIVKRLQLVAQILTNALARKRAYNELRESEMRLSMATTAAGAGLWFMDLDTNHVWVTPKTRELFHFAPDAALNDESFYELMHSEDREWVRQAVRQAVQNGETLGSEYRIVHPDGSVRWILALGRAFSKTPGPPERLMGVSIDITARKEMEDRLREQLAEIERLKLKLEQENIFLRDEILLKDGHDEIVGRSAAMKQVLAQVEQVAGTEATVLLQGETGTGKELLARTIHRLSPRKDRPLVTVNCASLPPTLIETELFGRERGAYTGAMTRMAGRFELADRSTLFLDEIGELPLDLQAKLLRVLEEGRFERLGSTKSLQVNVRIIAATNRNLSQEVAAGRFRKDLYYRLNVFPISIPPLRERSEDVPPLVWAFVKQYEKKMGKRIDRIPLKSMDALQRYPWPGNARELRNIIEHAMIISSGGKLQARPPDEATGEFPASRSLEEIERRHVLRVLSETGWRIAGKGGAAEVLGMKRTTLLTRIKKLRIQRPAS
jgi:formate hydrogenlyase transcriptional activator